MINLIKSPFYKEEEVKSLLIDYIKSSDSFSMSEQCRKFESKFSEWQGRKYSVFVNSGSSANLILMQSLLNLGKIKKDDTIGFSALTWATNVMPIIQLGLNPCPVDCSLQTLNVTVDELKKSYKKMKCMFITNVLGFCDKIDEIKEFAEDNDILFIEDNCEALGSSYGGKLLGNYGYASTCSFYVGHHLSTIEGGIVCTDDEELYHMLLMARSHGWDRNLNSRQQEALRTQYKIDDFYALFTFYDLGYNVRPHEMNAIIGSHLLNYIDEIVDKREKNYIKFNEAVSKNEELIKQDFRHMSKISNFAMPLIFKTKSALEFYKKRFIDSDIEIRPVVAGNIVQQPFYKKYCSSDVQCPNSDIIHENGFYFGNNPEMEEREIEYIVNLLEKCEKEYEKEFSDICSRA